MRSRRSICRSSHRHRRRDPPSYAGVAFAWDAVNEAIDDADGHGLKANIWYPDVPDYVDVAFAAARAADPAAKLFYNDYNVGSATGWSAGKSDAMYAMVAGMLDRGVPIDGVGLQARRALVARRAPRAPAPPSGHVVCSLALERMNTCVCSSLQMHIGVGYNLVDGVAKNMARYGVLGLEVHITELDISCKADDGCEVGGATAARGLRARAVQRKRKKDLAPPRRTPSSRRKNRLGWPGREWSDDVERAQAALYAALLGACLAEPACTNFESWGFTDEARRESRNESFLRITHEIITYKTNHDPFRVGLFRITPTALGA